MSAPGISRDVPAYPASLTRYPTGHSREGEGDGIWHGMAWHGMVWYGMAWHGMVWYGMVWYGMVWYGMVWYGMAWHGVAWHMCVFARVRGVRGSDLAANYTCSDAVGGHLMRGG